MTLIQFTAKNNIIDISPTNQFWDVFISMACWPYKGYHAGAYWGAWKIQGNWVLLLDRSKPVTVKGHSMGGAIAQRVGVYLKEQGYDVTAEIIGAYPAVTKKHQNELKGTCTMYGNDVVSKLFPWFKFVAEYKHIGPDRKWWKISFKDHVRYWHV